jgi:hypothetical protein
VIVKRTALLFLVLVASQSFALSKTIGWTEADLPDAWSQHSFIFDRHQIGTFDASQPHTVVDLFQVETALQDRPTRVTSFQVVDGVLVGTNERGDRFAVILEGGTVYRQQVMDAELKQIDKKYQSDAAVSVLINSSALILALVGLVSIFVWQALFPLLAFLRNARKKTPSKKES